MSIEKELKKNKKEMIEVLEHNNIFSKGFKMEVEGVEVSLTINDSGRETEVYATAESSDIDDAVDIVEDLVSLLSNDKSDVHVHEDDLWAESRFKIDSEKVEDL